MKLSALRWLALGSAGVGLLGYVVSCVDNSTASDPCPQYCSDMATTCSGVNSQYPDTDTCLRMCAAMTPTVAGNSAADTVECRQLNLSSAKDDPTPAGVYNDCINAGPSSGNCTDTQCQAFCKLDLSLCANGGIQYTTVDQCVTACAAWDPTFTGALIGSTGNSLECRTYHLELSQSGVATDLLTHCPHTDVISARCFASTTDAGTDAAPEAAADATAE